MRKLLGAASALSLCAGAASAAGVERTVQSMGVLFQEGNYVEFSIGRVEPDVSGEQQVDVLTFVPPPGPGLVNLGGSGANSGDVAEDYTQLGFGLKMALNDRVDLALILDQPFGADVNYEQNTGYLYGGIMGAPGSSAQVRSQAATALARYKFDDNWSVHGGLRFMKTYGRADLFNGYSLRTDPNYATGYVIGAAYERPEIALRVALTYNSAITHDFEAKENGVDSDNFETEIPQSVNLEFQSGVAADTLVFGSVRWVEWSAFDITPVAYEASTGTPLVSYNDDTVTYTLGVGRKFNEQWSGAVTASYEDAMGGFSGNLGPTDGATSIGLAATYTTEQGVSITGGLRHIWIGDAKTETPAALGYPDGTTFGEFNDNTAFAYGLRIAYNF
ncbi:MAG: hypothetical protein ABNH26_14160 [Celeribacter sp.]|jgi:long-subunit fatty acid transport protein